MCVPLNQSLVPVGTECGCGSHRATQSPGRLGRSKVDQGENTTFSSTLSSILHHLPSSPGGEWEISEPGLAFGPAGEAKFLTVQECCALRCLRGELETRSRKVLEGHLSRLSQAALLCSPPMPTEPCLHSRERGTLHLHVAHYGQLSLAGAAMCRLECSISRRSSTLPTITQVYIHVKGSPFWGLLHCHPEQVS